MAEIANFIRDDGMEYDCEVGSAMFKILSRDPRFKRVEDAQEEKSVETEAAPTPTAKTKSKA